MHIWQAQVLYGEPLQKEKHETTTDHGVARMLGTGTTGSSDNQRQRHSVNSDHVIRAAELQATQPALTNEPSRGREGLQVIIINHEFKRKRR